MIFFAFGIQYVCMTIAIVALFMQLSFAVGPSMHGRIADAAGNHAYDLAGYACAAIFAAFTLITVKPRFWAPPSQRQQEQHT